MTMTSPANHQTPPDPNAFLAGGGGKSATLAAVGDQVVGQITDLRTTQQTDFLTKVPKTWDNGDPMWQVVVSLQTDQREDANDDGIRNVYLKGSGKDPHTSAGAARMALQTSGASQLEVGGMFAVAVIGFGEPPKPGLNAPKQHQAHYKAPAPSADLSAIFGGGAAPAAPAPQAPPAAAPVASNVGNTAAPAAQPAPAAPAATVTNPFATQEAKAPF